MGTWPGQGPGLPILPGVGRGSTALVEERSAPHWAQGRTQEVGAARELGEGYPHWGPGGIKWNGEARPWVGVLSFWRGDKVGAKVEGGGSPHSSPVGAYCPWSGGRWRQSGLKGGDEQWQD